MVWVYVIFRLDLMRRHKGIYIITVVVEEEGGWLAVHDLETVQILDYIYISSLLVSRLSAHIFLLRTLSCYYYYYYYYYWYSNRLIIGLNFKLCGCWECYLSDVREYNIIYPYVKVLSNEPYTVDLGYQTCVCVCVFVCVYMCVCVCVCRMRIEEMDTRHTRHANFTGSLPQRPNISYNILLNIIIIIILLLLLLLLIFTSYYPSSSSHSHNPIPPLSSHSHIPILPLPSHSHIPLPSHSHIPIPSHSHIPIPSLPSHSHIALSSNHSISHIYLSFTPPSHSSHSSHSGVSARPTRQDGHSLLITPPQPPTPQTMPLRSVHEKN